MNPLGEAIRELREEHGWTQEELGRRVGIAANGISKRETGLVRVDAGERRKFAQVFGLTPEQFDARWRSTRIPRSVGGVGIPVINYSPAGVVMDYTEFGVDSGQGFTYIPRGDIDDDLAFAVVVVGDSMEPTLHEGDRVVFSPMTVPRPKATLSDRAIVFVRFTAESQRQGCCVARWFSHNEDEVQLKKDNPAYPTVIVRRDEIQQLSVAVERRTREGLS